MNATTTTDTSSITLRGNKGGNYDGAMLSNTTISMYGSGAYCHINKSSTIELNISVVYAGNTDVKVPGVKFDIKYGGNFEDIRTTDKQGEIDVLVGFPRRHSGNRMMATSLRV